MRVLLIVLMALLALPMHSTGASAQGLFSPVVTINDKVISRFEIEQREVMLRLFRSPGDLAELALEQLIEERLKQEALDAAGLRITEEGLTGAMAEFAGRANMELDQFVTVLGQSGVAEETFRDFVRINVSWRDYIRSRYADRAQISEAEIDQALGQSGASTNIEVLLSEIIIAAPPPQAQAAQATAERISRVTSTAAFEAEARRHSALPSRSNGGRLGWLPITNYPAQLRGLLLGLGQGEVTAPLPITNGIALFQMRGIREVSGPIQEAAAIEYAAYYIAGGLSESALRDARRVENRVDTCDDLYGVAQGQPPEVLERQVLPLSDIPQDVAIELARLDPGEVSYSLTRAEGETLVFLMLCGRTQSLEDGQDRDAVRNSLRSRRLAGYADALLADLRASATITYN